jgi:hypothetical protein
MPKLCGHLTTAKLFRPGGSNQVRTLGAPVFTESDAREVLIARCKFGLQVRRDLRTVVVTKPISNLERKKLSKSKADSSSKIGIRVPLHPNKRIEDDLNKHGLLE